MSDDNINHNHNDNEHVHDDNHNIHNSINRSAPSRDAGSGARAPLH